MPIDTATIWHRDGEVVLAVLADVDAGHLCSTCRKPIVTVKAAWDHRITDPAYRPGPWELGEDAFTVARHADGTPNHGGQPDLYAVSRCPKCKGYDTVVTTQEAYGDRITCSAPGCDRNDWYSIGD